MKKLIIATLVSLFIFGNAYADNCDWTQIRKLPDGGYEYNPTLNLCVGNLVQQNKIQAQQILDYQKAISLKDLAVKYDDERVALWQKSSDDELQRLNTIESQQTHSDWLYFGLGVATTFAAAYAASQLIHR